MPPSRISSLNQNPLVRDALMAKMMSDLHKIHKTFLDKVDEIGAHAERIQKLPKGDKGDTPTIDYDRIAEAAAKLVPPPKNGNDAEIDEDAIAEKAAKKVKLPTVKTPIVPTAGEIAEKVLLMLPKQAPQEIDHGAIADLVVEKLSDGNTLKMEHIKGLKQQTEVFSSQLAGKIYGKDTWARGGGDTVAAGSNVTLTRNPNGTVSINSTGGSGSTIYTETVSGTINGSNKIFTVPTTIINAIVLSLANSTYQAGVDFTTSGITITFVTAPDASLSGQPFWLAHT